MSLLQRYRAELAKEREGNSRAFANILRFGDKVYYIFVGLAIAAFIVGLYQALFASVGTGSQAKALAIFFGFLGAFVLVFSGMFLRGIFYIIFTDRRRHNG